MFNPKLFASGAGLLGVGALFGWAITADRWEQKTRLALADFDDIQDSLRKKTRRIIELEERISNLEQENRIVAAFETEEEAQEHLKELSTPGAVIDEIQEEEPAFPPGETEEETRTNLQRLISTYTGSDNEVNNEALINRAVVSSATKVPPFVISRELYAWDEEEGDEYSKNTLSYFPVQRVLLDEEEDPIEDIDNYVGWKNLRRFGDESGDPDVVFIRNRRLETDFEVVKKEADELPLHVKYGMGKAEFNTNRAAGLIKFREEDV